MDSSVQLDFTEGRLSLKLDPSKGVLHSFIELNNLRPSIDRQWRYCGTLGSVLAEEFLAPQGGAAVLGLNLPAHHLA